MQIIGFSRFSRGNNNIGIYDDTSFGRFHSLGIRITSAIFHSSGIYLRRNSVFVRYFILTIAFSWQSLQYFSSNKLFGAFCILMLVWMAFATSLKVNSLISIYSIFWINSLRGSWVFSYWNVFCRWLTKKYQFFLVCCPFVIYYSGGRRVFFSFLVAFQSV